LRVGGDGRSEQVVSKKGHDGQAGQAKQGQTGQQRPLAHGGRDGDVGGVIGAGDDRKAMHLVGPGEGVVGGAGVNRGGPRRTGLGDQLGWSGPDAQLLVGVVTVNANCQRHVALIADPQAVPPPAPAA
jgi:hypothetical protein